MLIRVLQSFQQGSAQHGTRFVVSIIREAHVTYASIEKTLDPFLTIHQIDLRHLTFGQGI